MLPTKNSYPLILTATHRDSVTRFLAEPGSVNCSHSQRQKARTVDLETRPTRCMSSNYSCLARSTAMQ